MTTRPTDPTQTTENQNTPSRLLVLYSIMEDSINKGSIVGLNMWSEILLECEGHILINNRRLFMSTGA